MDDARIAAALQRGDQDALAVVYSHYAPQLYDYCLTFFADPDAAADALHESMLVAASWARHLPNRDHFVVWLHALTRNECLRKLRGSSAPCLLNLGNKPRPVAASHGRTDPVLREVTDLVNRHGFTAGEIALILGVPPRRARALCARSASVLSRDRRAGAGVGRQVRPGVPLELRDRVLTSAAMPSRVAYRGELALPRLRSGFPVPLEHARGYRHRQAFVKVAAAVAVIGGLATAIAIPALSRHSVLGLVQATAPINEPSNAPSAPGGQVGLPKSPPNSETGPSAPSWEPSSPTPQPDPPAPGTTRGQITGLASKCVDVRSSSSAEGTPINLFPCNATPAQEWTMGKDGTLQALGKCMGVAANAPGSAVQLFTCTGNQAQQWNPQIDGTLINVLSGRCLELPGANTENFTVLTLANCTGKSNQVWRLPT